MNFIYLLLVIIGIALFILFFLIGYIIGKLSVKDNIQKRNKLYTENRDIEINDIDNTKFVVKIETDQLQKRYSELGEIKTSEENINNSISKLKNMKG